MSLTEDITTLAQAAKTASRQLSRMDTEEKNLCLISMADILESEKASIQEENYKDMELAQKSGLGQAMTASKPFLMARRLYVSMKTS